jgi:hypothetical protein
MVTIHGVLASFFSMVNSIVPAGIKPVHFWLTLLITFAIVFMLVQFIPIFNNNRGVAFIVAAVVSYFVASSAVATIVIAKLFPNVGIALMAIFGLLMVIAFLSPSSLSSGTTGTRIIVLIAMIFVLWATYAAVTPELQQRGLLPSEGNGQPVVSNSDVSMLIAVLIIIGVIWILVAPPKKPSSKPFERFIDALIKPNKW